MPLECKYPEPGGPLKRARELDGSDVERAPASKRHRLLTPSISDHHLDKPLPSPSLVPSQPQPARSLKRFLEHNDPDCARASKLPIHNWLQTVPPHRRTSAPPRLSCERALATNASDDHLHLSFVPSQNIQQTSPLNMAPSQGQSTERTSIASAQSSKPSTSSSIYRSILQNNGVFIDQTGEKIPKELRNFLDANILKKRQTKLPAEEVADTVNTAVHIANSAEGNIYNLIGAAMFPIKRNDVGQGGNTPWSTDALPRIAHYSNSLATPKPDIHIGYLTDMMTRWTYKENAIVDHRAATPYTRPTRGNCFPFLVFELKSEAAGGTLWQAENQAAGSGAHCVNSMRWLLREAYPSKPPSMLDTVAFTVVATHRGAVYYIHFYSDEDAIIYMSYFGTFSTLEEEDIQRSNDTTKNILEHGLGARQERIRAVLGDMEPCLERWKPSRPASVLDPAAESQGSNKSVRLA